MNGSALMGVVTIGNPLAPAFNGRGIVEVNQLCIRGDLNPMLRWNCCSKLYAHAATEAERRGFGRIITYIRADEEGTSLRAAGWVCDGPAGDGAGTALVVRGQTEMPGSPKSDGHAHRGRSSRPVLDCRHIIKRRKIGSDHLKHHPVASCSEPSA
jgi:hypothetical protein